MFVTACAADGDLGRYETVEMVKIGDTPATLRSVRRSRRIISAKVSTSSRGFIVGGSAVLLGRDYESGRRCHA